MKKIFLLVGILFWLVEITGAQETEVVEEVLTQIQEKLNSLNSYQAKIEMGFLQEEGGVMEIAGEIKYMKPDKLRMEIGVKGEERTKQYMYSDGNTLWQYMPFFKLATKVDLAQLKEEFPEAEELVKRQSNIQQAVSEIEKGNINYLGEEKLDGEKVYVFEGKINPAEKEKMDMPIEIAKARLWISAQDGLQRKAEFYSPDGSLVYYQKLSEVEVNLEIPLSEFEFQKPEDTNVLDTTAQARERLRRMQESKQE